MNTEQIEKILKGDAYAKQIFKGVYPRDKIPTVVKYPSAYVFNSDPSSKPGEHWIALYFDKKRRGEYFDSYGVGPQMHNLNNFMEKNSSIWTCNTALIQGPFSITCGHYCVYYLMCRCRGMSMKKILLNFDTNLAKNDQRVLTFMKDNFNINVNL